MDPGCHVRPVRHASHPAAAARHHSNVTWVWLVSRLSPEPQVSRTDPDPVALVRARFSDNSGVSESNLIFTHSDQ